MTTRDITRIRSEESKEAILEAARQLFAKRGYRGTSVGSVAEAAGISQSGLLHHYPSKNALLLAVLASRDSADMQMFSPRPQTQGIGIIDALAALIAHNQSAPQLVALFSMLLGEAVAADHPAREFFVQRYERIRAMNTQFLQEAKAADALAPSVEPEALANVLIAVMDGLQFQWLLDPAVDMSASYAALAGIIHAAVSSERTDNS